MKVLMITPYLTIKSRSAFTKNKTGFGYMVYDIARSIGKMAEVEVLASNVHYADFKQDGIKFLGVSYGKQLGNIFRCLPVSMLSSIIWTYKMPCGAAIRLVYYWLLTGYVSKLISRSKYDIVHIHGCGFFTEMWMQVCRKLGQKYVVTLHGLNSFSDTIRLSHAGKRYERDFLRRVTEGEFSITVISTGMKRLIEKTYNAPDCQNIIVVCNSFSFASNIEIVNKNRIREKYNIPELAKVVLYVGNISRNKNQQQMVEAFGLLPSELAQNTWVLFCGADNDSSVYLKDAISAVPYSSHLICCGAVPKDEMPDYYNSANAVALLSYAEGFGLSLIEGMHFGLPCMMFTDMDAFEDIYNPSVVVPINNRNVESVASAMLLLLGVKWDELQIKSYSMRFANDKMAHNYIEAYKVAS